MTSVNERNLDVLVIGGANTDFLVRGPTLPAPGSTVEGEIFQEAPGGKGANQAVAAARLGARVAFLGRVGADDRGTAVLTRLRSEHVSIQHVTVDLWAPTGVALVMVGADGEKLIMTAPGANRHLTAQDLARAGELIARARVLLIQLELPLPVIEAAIHRARAAGARVVLAPAPARELTDALLQEVEVIRPNAAEAEVLTGIKVTDIASAMRAAEDLLRRGVAAAVVGAPGGNLLVSSEFEEWFPHLSVRAVDATGAGDAFAAALAVSMARGEDLRSAAQFATAAAALKTTRLGAQAGLPTREEVRLFLEGERSVMR